MGLSSSGRLLAPRDERFAVEVRADLPLIEPKGERMDRSRSGRADQALVQACAPEGSLVRASSRSGRRRVR